MVYPATFEQKIGFDEIRTLLKGYCMSTLGKDEVDALKFSTQAKEINELLTHIREFRRILEESDDFPLQYFFDVSIPLPCPATVDGRGDDVPAADPAYRPDSRQVR